MIVDLLLVRHGYSCANAWKQKLPGLQGLYADPELTEQGKQLCEQRRGALTAAIDHYFHEHPYMIATSSMIRTQQTAYHMFLKGTDRKYTIIPHVAEEGITVNNFPLPAEQQKARLGSSVLHHLHEDLRGSTTVANKSNWPKCLAWIKAHGIRTAVIFTHGKFIQNALKEKEASNNDIFYAKVDTATGTILEKKRLTGFPNPPVSVEGCRIHTKRQFVTGGRTRRRYKRK